MGLSHLNSLHFKDMRFILIGLSCALSFALQGPVHAQPASPVAEQVRSVVDRFHAALAAGDAKSATDLLALDAVILESGELESRRQYLDHHLAADIKFAQSARSTRSNLQVTHLGEVAWVTSTSVTAGNHEGKPLNLAGAELMVLSRVGNGWLIRAIHWSSRKARS